jgi:hypothetical protein
VVDIKPDLIDGIARPGGSGPKGALGRGKVDYAFDGAPLMPGKWTYPRVRDIDVSWSTHDTQFTLQ